MFVNRMGKRVVSIAMSENEYEALKFAMTHTVLELSERRGKKLVHTRTDHDRRIVDHIKLLVLMMEDTRNG